ncbi:hypothetical protein BDV18DRAFT_162964 [Aspergillus unguis]
MALVHITLTAIDNPAAMDASTETCLFCFDDLTPDTPRRQLSCKHSFHSPCISEWVARGGKCKSCPLCRRKLGRRPWANKGREQTGIVNANANANVRASVFKPNIHWRAQAEALRTLGSRVVESHVWKRVRLQDKNYLWRVVLAKVRAVFARREGNFV